MKTKLSILSIALMLAFVGCNNEPVQTADPQTNSHEVQSDNSDSISANTHAVDNTNSNPKNQSDQMVPGNTGPKTSTSNP